LYTTQSTQHECHGVKTRERLAYFSGTMTQAVALLKTVVEFVSIAVKAGFAAHRVMGLIL